MKRVYITTAATALAILVAFFFLGRSMGVPGMREKLIVGFVYDNDESTLYTYNFSLAKDAVESKYRDKVEVLVRSNVLDEEMEEPIRELAARGCDIIFFNGYSELVMELAPQYPHIQFCQTSRMDMSGVTVPPNYHSFKGEAYQGRYVSGVVAGMKIASLISDGLISEDQAVVGFVAAFPTSEVISGYTAFLLGVRSVVPQAVMRVRYTETWSSFAQEKSAARQLIEEGCVVISQHTDTIGPAVACETAAKIPPVYHVGYNQGSVDVAPGTSLVASRICWEPYVTAAVEAVMTRRDIESAVSGNIHGTDVSAGFDEGWVEIIDLNPQITAPGTQEAVDRVVSKFRRGNGDFVFRGDYIGVDPDNLGDTIDLRNGYEENKDSSFPTFHYLLSDIITVE